MADTAPCIIAIMGNQKAWPVEAMANARLIAAAPDLLQVCKEELAALETWIRNETVRGDVLEGMLISRQKITTAIAKAKGESV